VAGGSADRHESNKTCLPLKSPSLSNSDQHLSLHWTILPQMARRASAESRPGRLSGISTFARETRASRPLAHVGAEVSGRITAIEIAHAQLYDVDVDRKKRIDDAIDYFGGDTSTSSGRVSANRSFAI